MLMARGHQAKIVCAGGDPMPAGSDFIDSEGVPVKMYGGWAPVRLRGYVYALGVAWTLWKERDNYDVAYFLMQGLQLVTGIPVARLAGKPVVMKFSGSSLVVGMSDSFTGRLSLAMLRRWASRILILNPGMLEECRQVNLDTAKVSWMPNPVDVERFNPVGNEDKLRLRRELGVGQDDGIILYVGRMGPEKRLPSLLRGFAHVLTRHPRARLVLVGDGPVRSEVEAVAAGLPLGDRLRLMGRLNMDGVLRWMQASDAIALVSEVEGLPCVLIEAMATGLPAIASRISGNQQIVENESNGLLTELNDEHSIAAAMERILNDPQASARMGNRARQQAVERFSNDRVAAMYEELFDSVTAT